METRNVKRKTNDRCAPLPKKWGRWICRCVCCQFFFWAVEDQRCGEALELGGHGHRNPPRCHADTRSDLDHDSGIPLQISTEIRTMYPNHVKRWGPHPERCRRLSRQAGQQGILTEPHIAMFRSLFFLGVSFSHCRLPFRKIRHEAIATFGRADVAGKAMQFALGEEHGIFITTPKDFPDPAPEAKKIRTTKTSEDLLGVGCICWVEVGWLVGLIGWGWGWFRKAIRSLWVREASYGNMSLDHS